MNKFRFSFSAIFLSITFSVGLLAQAPTAAWINEFHYDDRGGDNDQFIEVIVNEEFNDLSNFTVSKYDGGKPGIAGSVYGSEILSNFTKGPTQNGFTIYYFLTGFQNGSGGFADAIAKSCVGSEDPGLGCTTGALLGNEVVSFFVFWA